MLLAARRTGDLAVGHVADQDMAERVLLGARHRAPPRPLDEVLPLERVERLLELPPIAAAQPDERCAPEHLPDHGGVLQQTLLLRRKPVEPARDDALHTLGERSAGVGTPLDEHPRVLLRVQWIAARSFDDRRVILRTQVGRSGSARTSRPVSSSERGERARVVALSLPPPQVGRRSRNSGRAVPMTSSGRPLTHSTRWSTKSSRPSSAQWRSSNTSTAGDSSAIPSRNRRHAANRSI